MSQKCSEIASKAQNFKISCPEEVNTPSPKIQSPADFVFVAIPMLSSYSQKNI